MSLAPGDVFAGYTVLRQLGQGGMGAVYLAQHPRMPRFVALKLLRAELCADPDFARRFEHEVETLAGLSHPHIVSILDRGQHDGQLWLSMQYVDGVDGETALQAAGGLLPADRVLHIVTGVAAALDHAHKRNLVHRDVKPANVLLTAPGDDEAEWVFLTDFGIAKSLDADTQLTRTGDVVATLEYASPEQIEAAPLDARSDVYSLGCVAHRMLTGSVPFPGGSVTAKMRGHLLLPPPRPTDLVPWLAPAVDDVVTQAMAKDPAQRFPTCRALAAALADAIDAFPAPPPPPYRVQLRRTGSGPPSTVGPMSSDELAKAESERLADLVRRTRFFDLPESLVDLPSAPAGSSPTPATVTIEIVSRDRVRRVVLDPAGPGRPQALVDLLATVEAAGPAPPTEPTTRARVPAPAVFPEPSTTGRTVVDARTAPVAAGAPAHPTGPHGARALAGGPVPLPPPRTAVPDLPLLSTSPGEGGSLGWTAAAPTMLRGHETGGSLDEGVRCVAFSPDGGLLAANGDDETVELWDPRTGEHLRTLTGHGSWVHTVAFSPDGRLLATGSDDRTVRLWDPQTGEQSGALTGHGSWVHTVAFSPDGRLLATGSDDETVRLWDPRTGEQLRVLTGPQHSVAAVAFSPDGRLLAVGSRDKAVLLWDPQSGKRWTPRSGKGLHTRTGHSNGVRTVAFSPDGRLLATGGGDEAVRLWNPRTGKRVHALSGPANGVRTVAFSPDGRLLAAGGHDEAVRLWDPGTGEQVGALTGHREWVAAVAFSPDGRLFATGCEDGGVRVWHGS
ncbi:WD40 repeat domain-containing serine/threonine protein kinase [Geodermatophilus sp. SYSU D00965]